MKVKDVVLVVKGVKVVKKLKSNALLVLEVKVVRVIKSECIICSFRKHYVCYCAGGSVLRRNCL